MLSKIISTKTGLVGLAAGSIAVGSAIYYLYQKKKQEYTNKEDHNDSAQKKNTTHLTKKDALYRSSLLSRDVNYNLTVFCPKGKGYKGKVDIDFFLGWNKKGCFIDFTGDEIVSIEVNSKRLETKDGNYRHIWDGNRIELDSIYLQNYNNNRVTIAFKNSYRTDGQGFHTFTDTDGKQYIYTHFEPDFCHRWFPCFDQPDIKAVMALKTITPNEWRVIANEFTDKLESFNTETFANISDPLQKEFAKEIINDIKDKNGYVMMNFRQTPKMSTYLFALACGEFTQIKCDDPRYSNVPMSIFCRDTLRKYIEPDAESLFETVSKAIIFYENLFGYKFPFSKYDQIFCPEFSIGAMENVGAVTINDTSLVFKGKVSLERISTRLVTVVHELCHMWFGDLVTMFWWNDLWLKESFADCLAYYALSQLDLSFPTSDFLILANRRKDWGYNSDQLSTTHPIFCEVSNTEEAASIFDGITYSKGQSVIRQMISVLGPDDFSTAMKSYFRNFAWKNTTMKDFFEEINNVFVASSIMRPFKMSEWYEEWICKAGLNSCEAIWNPEASGQREQLIIKQFAVSPEHPTLRHHKMKVAFFKENGDFDALDIMLANEANTIVEYDGRNQYKAILLNYMDEAFIKIILDEDSLNYFLKNLEKVKDPLSRTLIWKSLYTSVRDAKTSSKVFVDLACLNILSEKETLIQKIIIDYSYEAVTNWTPDEFQKPYFTRLFASVLERIKSQDLVEDSNIEYHTGLVRFSAEENNHRLLVNSYISKDKEIISNSQTFLKVHGWTICEKAYRIPGFENDERKSILEAVKQNDGSDIRDRMLKKIEAIEAESPECRSKLWDWYKNPSENVSLYLINSSMDGFNIKERINEDYINRFFSSFSDILGNRTSKYCLNYLMHLFPSSENFDLLLNKIEEAKHSLPEGNEVFKRRLNEHRDTILRKQKAFALFINTLKKK